MWGDKKSLTASQVSQFLAKAANGSIKTALKKLEFSKLDELVILVDEVKELKKQDKIAALKKEQARIDAELKKLTGEDSKKETTESE